MSNLNLHQLLEWVWPWPWTFKQRINRTRTDNKYVKKTYGERKRQTEQIYSRAEKLTDHAWCPPLHWGTSPVCKYDSLHISQWTAWLHLSDHHSPLAIQQYTILPVISWFSQAGSVIYTLIHMCVIWHQLKHYLSTYHGLASTLSLSLATRHYTDKIHYSYWWPCRWYQKTY